MSSPRSIAPANPKGVKFSLCSKCVGKTPQPTGCMGTSCKKCSTTVRFHVAYCKRCSAATGVCQLCASPLSSATESTLSLRDWLETRATQEGHEDVDAYLDALSQEFSGGDGKEDQLIQLAQATRLDPDDERRIRAAFSNAGYGRRSQDIAIGQIIAAALAATTKPNTASRTRKRTKR